ncbi:MAG TPA: hypothetical protein VF788_02655, partial [Pseudonocardiaceae bacterium]
SAPLSCPQHRHHAGVLNGHTTGGADALHVHSLDEDDVDVASVGNLERALGTGHSMQRGQMP